MSDTKRVWVEIEAPPTHYEPQWVENRYPGQPQFMKHASPVLAVHHTPPGGISPEAQAVLDAAVAWERSVNPVYETGKRLACAVVAYAATIPLAPPDPLDEVRRMVIRWQADGVIEQADMKAALAALDRAKEKRA